MDSPRLAHPHDRLARHFLTRTELAADLIGNYLDPGLAERLDLSRLNCLSPVTVDGELGERAGDLRFSTFFKGGGLKSKVFLLLEHQSRSERHISFRIAEYVIKDFRERLNAKGSPG
ncbi:MAG: Rpn family recombination-promoting nuclease/putative transposase, partial [Planctomycetota bacterium]|nr:Rpn family recombination-promoting nuclease/putative transposase [Planctomycetota bacterium]